MEYRKEGYMRRGGRIDAIDPFIATGGFSFVNCSMLVFP
jgi:hypothetical protein